MEAEDLLHGVGAVIFRYESLELFLGNFLVFEALDVAIEGGVDFGVKIVILR